MAPVITKTGNSEDINDYLKVTVENTDLCKRYCARMVKNIHLAPSPKWLQHRLAASGIRPINNIVDITNYIMEEYGQPMHAFDYDLLAGHEIVVKCAKDGDVFQTLDGQERKLDHTVLMINDGEKEVGIAGIMGGENSKITDDVKTMVFECATFDGTNIRLSAKKVGLRTDASGNMKKDWIPTRRGGRKPRLPADRRAGSRRGSRRYDRRLSGKGRGIQGEIPASKRSTLF